MSLDFVILGSNGAPEKTVPLGVDLHHELVVTASACGLSAFQDFADYYEDVDVAADNLPSLAAQSELLRAKTSSAELQRFLENLAGLIAYCIANGRALHAIAD